jgi:hypothetical protein
LCQTLLQGVPLYRWREEASSFQLAMWV